MDKSKIVPAIISPFDKETFAKLKEHVRHIRMAFDAPGNPYHDANEPEFGRFNRWQWHSLPMMIELHHSPELIALASMVFGTPVKPSYSFLSMYGKDGVCPPHKDRSPCQFTIDLQIESDGQWPIYIENEPFLLKDGEALCYSGTDQLHYRRSMQEIPGMTFMNLAFFHWVPTNWMGEKK